MTSVPRTISFQICKKIIPPLIPSLHKGQAGKIAVVGGCSDYTGAPYFAAMSALKLGADLSHVFCDRQAAVPIKSYSPEIMVHPLLASSDSAPALSAAQLVEPVVRWLPNITALVVGPGLGRDPLMVECARLIIMAAIERKLPMVLDGDCLSAIVAEDISLIRDSPFIVLTPNVNEYRRIVAAASKAFPGVTENTQLPDLCNLLGNVTIVRKGQHDLISDGKSLVECAEEGMNRRCGGQGDVLAGCIATFLSWSYSPVVDWQESHPYSRGVLAGFCGAVTTRCAARLSFAKYKRGTITTSIVDHIPESYEDAFLRRAAV